MLNGFRTLVAAALLLALMPGSVASAAGLPRSLILEQGKLARYPTPPEGPGKWGVTAHDFSVLDDQELLRKAGLPDKRESLQVAAQSGDAYAQYLFGAWILGGGTAFPGDDGWRMMHASARQGVVRAETRMQARTAVLSTLDSNAARVKLFRMAATDNAFSHFVYGTIMHDRAKTPGDAAAARSHIQKAADLGYAPAKAALIKLGPPPGAPAKSP